MPRASRSRSNLSAEEKKKRRREQKKLSMRRARAKLDAAALEERRRLDRERYQRKKQEGLIKTIKDFTPRQQRQIRKKWREKSRLRREKEKVRKQTENMLQNNTPPSSPSSSFSRIESGRAVSVKNRRRLKMVNKVLSMRLQVLENKLAKYRMRVLRLKRKKQQNEMDKNSVKQKIHDFLLDDEHSRLTAGKKETITRRKVKKQIRLLNDSLLNLHKIFTQKTGLCISYETFWRHRPFWVLFPKAASRNTCLCRVHANADYIVHALHQAKIIQYSSAVAVAKSFCCNNSLDVSCLERKCQRCLNKKVDYNVINASDTIIYQRWITKNVKVVIKGQEKQFKKTLKESVKTTQKLLTDIIQSFLPTFMQHLANLINQYRAVRHIKQNLQQSDGLLHIDFSENYTYKYGTEIQSAHFGGSKGQLSLHTCVYYSTNIEPQNTIKTTSICTVSEELRHDPVLICAHLKPVIDKIKMLTPTLKLLHILSDGPTTQYRNKTMFHLIVNYLSHISGAETIIWHFTEAGHGKGAPDGVGGCVKRICDNAVANGRDITEITAFVQCLREYCSGIEIIPLEDTHVPEIQNIADAIAVRPFKWTFQIHQICWTVTEPNLLHARRLSCLICAANSICPHFEIGQIKVESVQLVSSPLSFASEAGTVSPAVLSPRTASVSTISGPRTPESLEPLIETPSPEPWAVRQLDPLTPRKMIEKIRSDDSLTPPKIPKVRRRRPGLFVDSDEENSPPDLKRRLDHFFSDDSDENIF